jgi:hypothetical protein
MRVKRVIKAVAAAAARAQQVSNYDKWTGVIVTLRVLIHCLSASRRTNEHTQYLSRTPL